jgi:hypothetical protein
MLKHQLCVAAISMAPSFVFSQGCSDAGFCTVGNFHAASSAVSELQKRSAKNQIDFSFQYATHGANEKYDIPQINWRHYLKKGSFFETRLPYNFARLSNTGISSSGIGDITATYNSRFELTKIKRLDYSIGFRLSLSKANKAYPDGIVFASGSELLPMQLQPGLGTTDLIAVINYDILKYISVGTGVQLPVFQYNDHKIFIQPLFIGNLYGVGFRRKADALLKLTGHYKTGKFNINGGLVNIFHLANDYYNTTQGKYVLQNSKGTTINWTIDLNYSFSDKLAFNLLYAEPLQTRKNIPDGLARSRIINTKFIFSF